jgi:choline dehydrogenase-like flavoprotein
VSYTGPGDVLGGGPAVASVVGSAQRVELSGGRATGVWVDGALHSAAHVVLAAGAVDIPLLLWRSGVEHPALGRHLAFHPVLATQVVLDESDPVIEDNDPLPRLGVPPTPDHPWFVMVLRDTNPLPVDPSDRAVPAHRLVEIQAFGPVGPHPDNHMWTDGDDRPRFDVPIRPGDRERLDAIERDVAELVDALGRVRRGCEPRWSPPGTAHLMGSCRMGERDDGTSVTDPDGRVRGIEGLDVAGNAVVPTRLTVNPTLTAVALALHGQRSRLT